VSYVILAALVLFFVGLSVWSFRGQKTEVPRHKAQRENQRRARRGRGL
jgi:hypothetical protein